MGDYKSNQASIKIKIDNGKNICRMKKPDEHKEKVHISKWIHNAMNFYLRTKMDNILLKECLIIPNYHSNNTQY